MNDLINDLRLKVGIARLDDNVTMVALNKDGTLRNPLDALEDFAQLIVTECISVIEEVTEDIENGDIFINQRLVKLFEERWDADLYYSIEKIEERLRNVNKNTKH